ncbi:MAG TPA: hypothetical protein VK003_09750 [Oceanobacillus sp.]|nr:hypothetical protein [Oceanobacillus sp.]
MRFTLYTDKPVSQCMSAITERLHVKGTSTRPGIDGWVDKKGIFSMGVSSPVIGKLHRKTYLRAKIERENGVTIIKGDVPTGASPQGQLVVFGALALVALVLIVSGSMLLGLIIIPFAAILYIPMKGDYHNSEFLLNEVQKTLKAKPTPPKPAKSPAAKSAARP